MKLIKSPDPLSPYHQKMQEAAEHMDALAFDAYEMALVLYRLKTVGLPFGEFSQPHDPIDPDFVPVHELQSCTDRQVEAILRLVTEADESLMYLKEYWKTVHKKVNLI